MLIHLASHKRIEKEEICRAIFIPPLAVFEDLYQQCSDFASHDTGKAMMAHNLSPIVSRRAFLFASRLHSRSTSGIFFLRMVAPGQIIITGKNNAGD